MGYWIYTPEQGERIRAGDKAARDQFFSDNYERLCKSIRYKIRKFLVKKEDILGYLNTVYLDLHNWEYGHGEHFLLTCLDRSLVKAQLTPRERELRSKSHSFLPEIVDMYTNGGKDDDEYCIIDHYHSDSIDLPSDHLTADNIALFFKPFFSNKKYCDILYYICLGNSINQAFSNVNIRYSSTVMNKIRAVFIDHYFEFLDFLECEFPESYNLLSSYSGKVNELKTLNDERIQRNLAVRREAARKRNFARISLSPQKTAL